MVGLRFFGGLTLEEVASTPLPVAGHGQPAVATGEGLVAPPHRFEWVSHRESGCSHSLTEKSAHYHQRSEDQNLSPKWRANVPAMEPPMRAANTSPATV